MEHLLLIADDDPAQRESIRRVVESSKLGISRVLEAGDGREALRLAITEEPDVLLLDVRMPEMTGLEVVERLGGVSKRRKVIFCSGYSYFDYAVRAMQLGALDYLTKPAKREALLRALSRAIDELDEAGNRAAHELRVTDMRYVLEKRILRECVTGQVDDETIWFLENMDLTSDALCCAFYWEVKRTLSEVEKEEVSRHLRRELEPTGYPHMLFVHRRSIDFLLFGNKNLERERAQALVLDIFRDVLHQHDIETRGAVGSWVDDTMQIERSYTEAQLRVSGRATPPDFDRAMEQEGLPAEKPLEGKTPPEIQKMCEYLEAHYTERVGLEDVTGYAGFSKYYGGRVFKQFMGTTIIDYLIRLRLEQAKKLLAESDLSIKQIGYEVGYQDPNYFTWSFKKATGMSPVKYRYFLETNPK